MSNEQSDTLKIKQAINRIANVYPTFLKNNWEEPVERLALLIQEEILKEKQRLEWILDNSVQLLKLPNNTPIKLFPNGKIRIESMGTFDSINEAYYRLQRKIGNFSANINDS
jgi:hypothetical protein